MTTPEALVRDLDEAVAVRLSALGKKAQDAAVGQEASVAELLVMALKKELEATEEAAMWLVTETDVEVKLALARQCGDEAKHYRLIEERLRGLGVDPRQKAPASADRSPMFHYLAGLETTVERVAAGQFTREALAQVHNAAFIELCEARGDAETAALYRDVIQPDEGHHHALGRALLLRLAVSDADQEGARRACERTLAIAEELQEIVQMKRGIGCAPGC